MTAAGTAIAISAAAPSTPNAAGYRVLTYTEIGGVEQIGAIGATTAKVEFQPLKGAKQKHKGPSDHGSLQPTIAIDEADAGQAMLRTASEPKNAALYSFRVTYPTGAERYFRARAFGYPETVGNADSLITATPTVEIDGAVVKLDGPTNASPAGALSLDGTSLTSLSLDGSASTILILE